MKQINLTNTDISCSKLGFGCASVMGAVGKKDALRAMNVAFDEGINYFDVARSYGFGEAEKVLGEFTKNKRDKVIITTKFGIKPSQQNTLIRHLKPFARQLINTFPQLKNSVRKTAGNFVQHGNYSIDEAKASFEKSLRDLKHDYVDILLIHEPSIDNILSDELFEYLDRCVESGKIRCYGLAASQAAIDSLHSNYSDKNLKIMQYAYNVISPKHTSPKRVNDNAEILFSPFGGKIGFQEFSKFIGNNLEYIHNMGISELDKSKLSMLASQIMLSYAAQKSESCLILCSMFNEKHIRQNVNTLENIKMDKNLISDLVDFYHYSTKSQQIIETQEG